jgi:hypothetical protein
LLLVCAPLHWRAERRDPCGRRHIRTTDLNVVGKADRRSDA